jgi:hypothetical protein
MISGSSLFVQGRENHRECGILRRWSDRSVHPIVSRLRIAVVVSIVGSNNNILECIRTVTTMGDGAFAACVKMVSVIFAE